MLLMVSKFSSAVLALLLAFGAVWGQCGACPLIAPRKDCCNRHAGNCQMPSPKSDSAKTCPNLALAPVSHHDTQPTGVQFAAPVATVAQVPAVSFDLMAEAPVTPNTGPPDLYLLNSVLRV
jgi:hypothetical protein